MKKENKIIYYKDELNDDFGTIPLSKKDHKKFLVKYRYKKETFIDVFLCGLLYWGIIHWILDLFCFFCGIKVEGKDNLKSYIKECKKRKTGGFIYSNHVSNFDAFQIQAHVFKFKRVNIVGYPHTLANPLLRKICRTCGYLPLPEDIETTRKFLDGIKFSLNKGQHVLIYPEAHIWPYYTKIRPFKNGSFKYPCKYNAIAMPIITVFRKRKFFKTPKRTLIIGKWFAPNNDLTELQAKEELRNNVYNEMIRMSELYPQYEYYKYKKISEENSDN